MHNKKVQCGFKVAFNLHHFWDLDTYMINIKLLGILSRLSSFALFNDNLFNKLFVSGPLKYKKQINKAALKNKFTTKF